MRDAHALVHVPRCRGLVLAMLATATACAAAGWAGGAGDRSAASPGGPACPLGVAGTRVVAYEIPSGVAITFGTDPAHVDAVRESTRVLVNAYNMRHDPREGPAATPPNQLRATAPGAIAPLPPSHARVRDVANGSAMEVLPLREPDLQRLRDEIVTRWKDDPASCPPDAP